MCTVYYCTYAVVCAKIQNFRMQHCRLYTLRSNVLLEASESIVNLIHKNKIMVDEILGAARLYFIQILTIRNIDATNIAGVFVFGFGIPIYVHL